VEEEKQSKVRKKQDNNKGVALKASGGQASQ
jgi:hypothetical protein